MTALFTLHSKALAAAYADLENHAFAQGAAFLTAPGSVSERTNAGGFRYYALQQYDHEGVRRESYLAGPVGDARADEMAAGWKARIAEQREVVASLRLLIREGYAALDPKHYVAVAALGILRSAGLAFEPVPNFDPRDPPIKFKERGRSRFTVDLLVPSPNMEYSTQYVPELDAHAVALPYFRYLVAETQPAAAISRTGCVAVRVPVPERFAIHKLLVAKLRTGKPEKSQKDLRQAAILLAALGELHPGAIGEAFARTPVSARSRIRASMLETGKLLAGHPRAIAEIEGIVSGASRKR